MNTTIENLGKEFDMTTDEVIAYLDLQSYGPILASELTRGYRCISGDREIESFDGWTVEEARDHLTPRD